MHTALTGAGVSCECPPPVASRPSEVTLSQIGKPCPLRLWIGDYRPFGRDGILELGRALKRGMTPIVSYWGAGDRRAEPRSHGGGVQGVGGAGAFLLAGNGDYRERGDGAIWFRTCGLRNATEVVKRRTPTGNATFLEHPVNHLRRVALRRLHRLSP